ncbi:putative MFS-type transporter YhjX [Sedimentisphaera cyanobacteriorum]|uniref:Putative MFS-type transporter YhjX n=1 Tax=Sedimentisphaera cyanobacteriorum TaxID=1940790 RepID=A0A1Q2HN79_9BACT|nr:MFS transporter [Sedimentisphaera cyanobacteriorum]AQQ08761.1 putative MFS-type transporter YhjX [Sedimentisphaera cyanobacteriorum]
MKKLIVLIAGVLMQSVLGGVYAWSVFIPSLTSDYGQSNGQASLIFGINIAVFTVVMIPAGRLLGRFSPRKIAFTGALLFSIGYLTASFSGGNFAVILGGIGIVAGAGIGAGYVCPLTVGMKWFPNNKGLVTGVVVAGFGGGAIALSSLSEYLLTSLDWNVLEVFRLIGYGFGGLAIAASLFLKEPELSASKDKIEGREKKIASNYLLSKPFVMLCTGMFAGTFAGLLVIGNLKPILLSLGLTSEAATLGISIFAVGNASGRIIWGQIHDKFGVRPTILASLAALGLSVVLFAFEMPEPLLIAATLIAGINFGACFVVYASSMVAYFGTELFPSLYPICFLWYGLAGIIGPGAGGWIADSTGTFTIGVAVSSLTVFAAFAVNAFGLSSPIRAEENTA